MMGRKHTPIPWQWFQRKDGEVYLATPNLGHLIVMDFIRRGMQWAEPRFAVWEGEERGNMGGIMKPASKLGDISKHPDAAFLCRAANSHYALLEFAKDALREIKERALNDEQALCHVPLENLVEAGEKAIADADKE